jgi:hypothetical protein
MIKCLFVGKVSQNLLVADVDYKVRYLYSDELLHPNNQKAPHNILIKMVYKIPP